MYKNHFFGVRADPVPRDGLLQEAGVLPERRLLDRFAGPVSRRQERVPVPRQAVGRERRNVYAEIIFPYKAGMPGFIFSAKQTSSMKHVTFLAFAAITLLASCGKLTREEAASRIRQTHGFPKAVAGELPKQYNAEVPGGNPNHLTYPSSIHPSTAAMMQELESDGLVASEESEVSVWKDWFFQRAEIRLRHREFSLAPQARQFGMGKGKKSFDVVNAAPAETIKVRLYEEDLGEITGIVEQELPAKSMRVSYTVVRKGETPFNAAFKEDMSIVQNREATFVKYDDGWGIE